MDTFEKPKMLFCFGALDEIEGKLGINLRNIKKEDEEKMNFDTYRQMSAIAIRWATGNKIDESAAQELSAFIEMSDIAKAIKASSGA